jgi:hypothetical protein
VNEEALAHWQPLRQKKNFTATFCTFEPIFFKIMIATGRESPRQQPDWCEKLTQIFKPLGNFL